MKNYLNIDKQAYKEIKESGECPESVRLMEIFNGFVEELKVAKEKKKADDFLNKLY